MQNRHRYTPARGVHIFGGNVSIGKDSLRRFSGCINVWSGAGKLFATQTTRKSAKRAL
jgi:hypothetical protein